MGTLAKVIVAALVTLLGGCGMVERMNANFDSMSPESRMMLFQMYASQPRPAPYQVPFYPMQIHGAGFNCTASTYGQQTYTNCN